ncbi:MAG: type IV pilin protein, partial [Pseudomonadales bacterium]
MSNKPSTALPVAAVLFFVFWPVGVLLSIASIAKHGRSRGTRARTISIFAVTLNIGICVPAVGFFLDTAGEIRCFRSRPKGLLNQIAFAEKEHHSRTGTYTSNVAQLMAHLNDRYTRNTDGSIQDKYYRLSITKADQNIFTAQAVGTGLMDGDFLIVSESGGLETVEATTISDPTRNRWH